jgi:hypothetical protein
MSSYGDDVLGLRDELESLRLAIEHLGRDVRAAARTLERTPGQRLSGGEGATGRTKEEARQDAVEALANALAVEFGAPDAHVRFGPMPGVAPFQGNTGFLGPRGPAASVIIAVFTQIMNRKNSPVAPIVPAATPTTWPPAETDVDVSALNVTADSQLVALSNTTAIESAADAVLSASAWATTVTDEATKNRVESMSDEDLQILMDELVAKSVAETRLGGASQQVASPSAPVPPDSEPQSDAGASRGWGSIAWGALSFIQNNPLAQAAVVEIAKRVNKALGTRKATPGSAAEPAPPHVAAQETPTPQTVDDDQGKEEFLDAFEDTLVEDTTTRAELLRQEAATAPPHSPPGSFLTDDDEAEPDAHQTDPKRIPRGVSALRVASAVTEDDSGSPTQSASRASSSSESSLSSTPSFHQTLEEAAHEHAAAACGDTPGERADLVNSVIQAVKTDDAGEAKHLLEGVLNEACAARARGILEDALLDAQSLRERVKQLASSINHT